jgi:hypothetical protein
MIIESVVKANRQGGEDLRVQILFGALVNAFQSAPYAKQQGSFGGDRQQRRACSRGLTLVKVGHELGQAQLVGHMLAGLVQQALPRLVFLRLARSAQGGAQGVERHHLGRKRRSLRGRRKP